MRFLALAGRKCRWIAERHLAFIRSRRPYESRPRADSEAFIASLRRDMEPLPTVAEINAALGRRRGA